MISDVSARTGIAIDDILGRSHVRDITTVRHLYFKLLREKKCLPVTKIARLCERDHSTITNGIKHVSGLMEIGDKYTMEMWDKIKEIEP